ncbi:MAG: chemotaxis protein CheW [Bryobacteraceae bacterium]
MEDRELINEFLIESGENLNRLETEIVDLEQRPKDPALLASIFRTIHTIKGTCGFLSFGNLENVTHIAENILSQLRNGERSLTPQLTSLVLEMMDAIRKELASIEATSLESGETYDDLRARLTRTCNEIRPEISVMAPSPADHAGPGKATVTEAEESAPRMHQIVPTASELRPPAAVAIELVEAGQACAVSVSPPNKVSEEISVDPPAVGANTAEAEKQTATKASIADSTIRVDVGLLDKLMNLVGELVLARNQILQFSSKQDDGTLNATAQRLNLITTQLQEGVMKTRMQPIGVVWNKLPRVVRDLAASCGKQIQLDMDGAETELDKSIIEAIKDPLTHIVRNCCDHGIETPETRMQAGKSGQGRLLLRAYHEGGQVNIEIIDDGGGINITRVKQKAVERGLLRPEQAEQMTDREAANLVFLPGLSTAKEVTSISGRGVGMDVVKTNIEKIGGVVDLTSRPGDGTTVKIKIPLTLAIIPGLVVSSGGERFIIPQVSLLELLRVEGEAVQKQIERIHGAPVYRRRGSLLPIAFLNEVLRLPDSASESDVLNIVVLQAENRQFGLVVDDINDTQEIVVKPLSKQLKGMTSYAGATIMGDGKVALILDVLGIGQLSGVLSESLEHTRTDDSRHEMAHEERQTFLLFRAGSFERIAVPLSLVARLEEFPASRIERAGGKLVVQYRERILQLTPLAPALGAGPCELTDPAQVIVFAEGDRMAGLVVDQILDIHDEAIHIGSAGSQPRLTGSAVLGGKVTDFIDLPAVLRTTDEAWGSGVAPKHHTSTPVLVADASAFSRGQIRNYLEISGYPVVEASGPQEALAKLGHHPVGAVVVSLPPTGAKELLEEMRRMPSLKSIPVITVSGDDTGENDGRFDARVDRFDRGGLLRSLERLSEALNEEGVSAELASVGGQE